MDIKYKMFPYPVLAYFSDDYKNSAFEVLAQTSANGYNLRLDFTATLKNKQLQALIDEGKAAFVYHLECAQTGFRTVVQTDSKIASTEISYKDVCGRLQICPFIVAITNIENYTNEAFHEDYAGLTFNIEVGCVMAVGRQMNADVEKMIDDLSHVPSVFSIIKTLNQDQTYMNVDMTGKKIIIELPEKDYQNFAVINRVPALQAALNSMVIIPALVYVFEEIHRLSPEERYTSYDEQGWYRSIRKVLFDKFGCNIESEEFNSKNMVELAQRIINEPIHEGLTALLGIDPDNDDGGGNE